MEDLVKLDLISVTPSNFGSNSFILLLKGFKSREYVFPIVIGALEAQAISVFFEKMQTSRPLTHELFLNTLNRTSLSLNKIIITQFVDGIFYSNLVFQENDRQQVVDARPSDAIALAIKSEVDIFIDFKLLEQICIPSIEVEDELEELDNKVFQVEQTISVEEIQTKLNQAIKNEDYELAALLRDQLNNLK